MNPHHCSALTDKLILSPPVCSRDTSQNAQFRAIDTQSAFDTVSNHPVTQSVKDTVSQGLVGSPGPLFYLANTNFAQSSPITQLHPSSTNNN